MKLALFIAMIITVPVMAQPVHWTYAESTGGENILWVSQTAVDPQADQFDYVYDITYVAVDIIFLGQVIGPIEVTQDIDPTIRHGVGLVNGPAPIVMVDMPIEVDADLDGNIDLAAVLLMQINAGGFGQFDMTNVFLGTVWVDMGFPFGMQEVQIDRLYMSGQIDVTAIYVPCPEDIDGDGIVNVNDILTTIGNWGGTGQGDVNGDGVVNVSDLLAIVGAWGPC